MFTGYLSGLVRVWLAGLGEREVVIMLRWVLPELNSFMSHSLFQRFLRICNHAPLPGKWVTNISEVKTSIVGLCEVNLKVFVYH